MLSLIVMLFVAPVGFVYADSTLLSKEDQLKEIHTPLEKILITGKFADNDGVAILFDGIELVSVGKIDELNKLLIGLDEEMFEKFPERVRLIELAIIQAYPDVVVEMESFGPIVLL